jgi:hypothetical protein
MGTNIVKVELAPPLQSIIKGLPENYQEALRTLAQKANPRKKGLSDEQGSGNWNPPNIRTNQPTTRNTGGLDDLKQGEMFTSLGDRLGTELEFIILYRYVTHTRWNPGEFGGAPNCSSPGVLPGQDRLSVFGDKCNDCPDLPFRDGQKTSCNKNMVYWILDANAMDSIYSVQFSKTSYRVGSKLYKLARSQPMAWSRKFKLSTVKISNARGVYYAYDISLAEKADEHQQAIADAFYEVINANRTGMLERLYARAAAKEQAPDETTNLNDDVVEEGVEPEFNI